MRTSEIRRVHVWDVTTGKPPSQKELDNWWDHFCKLYARLVPVAEEYDVKNSPCIPSDNPLPDTPFGGLGYHRIIDALSKPQRRLPLLHRYARRSRQRTVGASGNQQLRAQRPDFYGSLQERAWEFCDFRWL